MQQTSTNCKNNHCTMKIRTKVQEVKAGKMHKYYVSEENIKKTKHVLTNYNSLLHVFPDSGPHMRIV